METTERAEHVDDDELLRFVEGALDEARAAAVRSHVDECDECRELLAVAGREAAAEKPPPADSDVSIGDVIEGRFRVDRLLGRGGMGVVYAAVDIAMQRRVAVKLLKGAVAEEAVTRFLRETRLAAKLTSPHVVRVFDVGRLASGMPYMVMEMLEGGDLEKIVRREGPIDETRALRWIRQACAALGEAHRAGIVHRDVKLSNIFLAKSAPDDIVKVLDFGLAKAEDPSTLEASLTRADQMMGTPHYMSPEQLVSTRNVDARTDVWALGVCLYRLLTARVPFDADNIASLTARILGTSPKRPRDVVGTIGPAVESVVMRCLAREAPARFADADELGGAIDRLLDPSGDPTIQAITMPLVQRASVVPPPPIAPVPVPQQKKGGVLPIAIAGALVLGTIGIVVAMNRAAPAPAAAAPPPPKPVVVPSEEPPPPHVEPPPSQTVVEPRPSARPPRIITKPRGRPAPADSSDRLYEKM